MSTIVPKVGVVVFGLLTVSQKTPVKVSRAKSANASVSLFVSELKEILNNQTACVPNKEMLDLAKEVIEVNNLPIQPDELLNRANYYGYILKQGTFWKTNV
ncbi:hypothetical protein BEWA_037410 [Theileria equi strain WA]|uniref:Uncharacterized protein n=1 Tax=Theileria equi strain WA TaxID=1537102 RepID=L1LEM5_THEEQ|nr:hypothetical protein BEWA_037410 [Theileria equi strain WA]EKX73705.1 hypothetical protein BEWA_037410 [Theileria equi strain WA]|eukprot:XP_004833157.1 hypothetical protein BEWA_037410 [Theileria equi strain WA]